MSSHIIDNTSNDNFIFVKNNNDFEYKNLMGKKILIFIDKYENYYDDINKILNREKILYRNPNDYCVNQLDSY